jgi:hypothetical protein
VHVQSQSCWKAMSVAAGGDFWANLIYLPEKNGVNVGFGCEFLVTKGGEGKVESREIGKCFHTWNMGFPLGGGWEAANSEALLGGEACQGWSSSYDPQAPQAYFTIQGQLFRNSRPIWSSVETASPHTLLCLCPKESHLIRIVFDQLGPTHS